MLFIHESFVCLLSFFVTFYIFLFSYIFETSQVLLLFHFLAIICWLILSRIVLSYNDYQIFLRSFLLGVFFNGGLFLSTSDLSYRLVGWYLSVLCFFHWSEYFVTSITNPLNLNMKSFLLDHSQEYHLALASSFIEYCLEWILLPSYFSEPCFWSFFGLAMVVGGEVLRKGAMLSAGSNFSHYVRARREEGHQLVTSGLYSLCRHPSYVGWFYWCIGTQVMVCNPVCAVLYAVFSWFFFRERIIAEEYTLLRFFGESYARYKRSVVSGIPFISGYDQQISFNN